MSERNYTNNRGQNMNKEIITHTPSEGKTYLSGYATTKLLRMADHSKWVEWFSHPPQDLQNTIADLQRSGLTPEICKTARLVPLTYFLRRWEEDTARSFIKNITGLSSSKVGYRKPNAGRSASARVSLPTSRRGVWF